MLARFLAFFAMMIIAVPACASPGYSMFRQCKLVFHDESGDSKSLDTEAQIDVSWIKGYRKGACLGFTAGAIEAARTVDTKGLCLPETVSPENVVIRMLWLFEKQEKEDMPATFYEIVRQTLVEMHPCEK